MCLLVHQPKTTKFSDEFLADVFSSNRDGFGVMYAEAGRLQVARFLLETADEFIAVYRAHADGRECIWHARMQTHGVIDLGNCHPYSVTPGSLWRITAYSPRVTHGTRTARILGILSVTSSSQSSRMTRRESSIHSGSRSSGSSSDRLTSSGS